MPNQYKAPSRPLVAPGGLTDSALLTPDETAAYLAVSTGTLGKWRARNVGPSWIRMPRQSDKPCGAGFYYLVRYRFVDVVGMIDRLRVVVDRLPNFRPGRRPADWTRHPELWEPPTDYRRRRRENSKRHYQNEKKALADPNHPAHLRAKAKRDAHNAEAREIRRRKREALAAVAIPAPPPSPDTIRRRAYSLEYERRKRAALKAQREAGGQV